MDEIIMYYKCIFLFDTIVISTLFTFVLGNFSINALTVYLLKYGFIYTKHK